LTTEGKGLVPRIGDLLILTAAFCFSSALIITKPLTKKVNSDIISLASIGFAFVFVLIFGLVVGVDILDIVAFPYVLIVGLLAAILPIFLNKTIAVSSASYLTMMSMVVPVIVVSLSLIFLKEPVNLFQAVGALLILGSGVLVAKSKI